MDGVTTSVSCVYELCVREEYLCAFRPIVGRHQYGILDG